MLENEITLPKALRRNAYYRYQYQRKTPFTHCKQKKWQPWTTSEG